MINNYQKNIYNNHLVASRKSLGKPFRIKKDFTKTTQEVEDQLNRLEKFFQTYQHIDQEDFFFAPFKVYPDETYYPLEYFLTRKAISTYTLYMKELEEGDPDSPVSLQRLVKSLNYVIKYCRDNDISLDDYEYHTKAKLPEYITHLKEHKINFNTIHVLQFQKPKIQSDILDFFFKDFYITFQKTKNSYFASKKMKEFGRLAKIKLNATLKQEKENNN